MAAASCVKIGRTKNTAVGGDGGWRGGRISYLRREMKAGAYTTVIAGYGGGISSIVANKLCERQTLF